MVKMLLSFFSILRLRYFIYGLLMVLVELCLLFSALLFVILASLKLLSFNFVFAFGFVFLAVLSWYLFEHFHIINLPYTYEVYNLLSKIFYSLLALRIAFLTIIATYSIIAFAFVNFELFVAEACGGEVIKAGTKVASFEVASGFNKKLISSSLESKLYDKSLMVYDPVVAKCAIKASSSNILDGLRIAAKHEPADILKSLKFKSFYLSLQKEVKLMSEGNGVKIIYPFLFFNEEDGGVNNEFVNSLTRMKPYFGVMLKMIEDDFVNNSRLLLFDTSLYLDAEFKKAGEQLKSKDCPELPGIAKDRIVLIKRMFNFYFNEFSDKEAMYLIGDPARMRDSDLRSDSFDLIFFYENLKHRVYPETFKVAEPRLDASKTIVAKGMGDFVAKFKGDDNELTYCEGKTAHYFNNANFVGYLDEENYSYFEENICNYVENGVEKAARKNHFQLAYHMSKGRQVAYVFNFCNIYTKDPELLLRIEEKLNEDLVEYIPSRGAIRLACSKLDDKIIQSENLD